MFGNADSGQMFLVIPDYAKSLLPDNTGDWEILPVESELLVFFPEVFKAKPFHTAVRDNALPFNKVYYHEKVSVWPSIAQSLRYDHEGTRVVQDNMQPWDADLMYAYRLLLSRHTQEDSQLTRACQALLTNTNWLNQERNATLHRTRRLLGDPDCGAVS